MKLGSVILILVICYLGIIPAHGVKQTVDQENRWNRGDYGDLQTNDQIESRKKRDSGSEAGINPPNFGSTPVQTSYFLGQCLMCPPGGPGPRGTPGVQGMAGRDGRDGRDQPLQLGMANDGSPAIEQPPPPQMNMSRGTSYIHWGNTNCPDGSVLVYKGVVGGKKYTEKGSGTNYLCLHGSPVYDRPVAGRGSAAIIYGTEFESSYTAIPNLTTESELSCAVCLAVGKNDVLMIPGVNNCPEQEGWYEEYHGYLAAMHGNYFATEFICLDHEAEGIPRTGHDNDPSLLYLVEYGCSSHGGGLPCPPYVDGYEVTCAVCSL